MRSEPIHRRHFIQTAAETIRIIDSVNSDWFGSILDIGSLRVGDTYSEIEKLVPYAVSWQLKEEIARYEAHQRAG